MARFTNKVVLITGGNAGIGAATAIAFAKEGASVVIAGRRESEGQAVVGELKKLGAKALFVKTDVTKEAEVKALVERTVKEFGKLDIAFNNAGVESAGPATEITEAEYRKVFDINVLGVILSMKHQLPALLKNGGGSIINTASVAGHIGMSNFSTYVASKHAVLGLTKGVAIEYAKQNVRINAVSPAAIETTMFDRFANSPESKEYMAAMHPVGRVGTPAEVASAVLFLASDEASFVTGQSLLVDGGFTAQ